MPEFRAKITTRDGRVIYASDYGLRGFPIGGARKIERSTSPRKRKPPVKGGHRRAKAR